MSTPTLLLKHAREAVAGRPGVSAVVGSSVDGIPTRQALGGLTGACVMEGRMINVADVSQDARFAAPFDRRVPSSASGRAAAAAANSNFSMLLAPVRWPHRTGPVLAVVSLATKAGGTAQPFTAHDERLIDAVTVHLGHTLSKLGPELALDEDRVPRAVPCWKLGSPLRLCVVGAANVALEGKKSFLGVYYARTIAVQVELFHGATLLTAPLTTDEISVVVTRLKDNAVPKETNAGSGGSSPVYRSRAASSFYDVPLGGDDDEDEEAAEVHQQLNRLYAVPADVDADDAASVATASGPRRARNDSSRPTRTSMDTSGGNSGSTENRKIARAQADFHMWMTTDLPVRALPRATRIIFTLLADGREPIAWAGMQLFTYAKQLTTGGAQLKLWPGGCPTPLATHPENTYGEDSPPGSGPRSARHAPYSSAPPPHPPTHPCVCRRR